jgi:hypothetical protein
MSSSTHTPSLRGRAVKALGTLALTLVTMSTTRGSPARLVFWRRREIEDVERLRDLPPGARLPPPSSESSGAPPSGFGAQAPKQSP